MSAGWSSPHAEWREYLRLDNRTDRRADGSSRDPSTPARKLRGPSVGMTRQLAYCRDGVAVLDPYTFRPVRVTLAKASGCCGPPASFDGQAEGGPTRTKAATSARSEEEASSVPLPGWGKINLRFVIPTGGTTLPCPEPRRVAVPEWRYGFPSHVFCAMNPSSTSDFRINRGRQSGLLEGAVQQFHDVHDVLAGFVDFRAGA